MRNNRNDDHSPSYAKPSARPVPSRNKAAPSRQPKKGSAAPKPGANAKPKVDTGMKNRVIDHDSNYVFLLSLKW